jgi:nucleoside-diphosphate-sugar epimerase
MKVFLTGATGFIGSHIARVLLNEGCEVFALVRESSPLWRISDIASEMQLVRGSLSEFEQLNAHLKSIQPEVCIHSAWSTTPGEYLTSPTNLCLLKASLQLASRLAAVGCRRFVGIGSCFEYDTSRGYLSEDSPTKPASLYAASKLALGIVLEQLANTTGMEVAWPRLFYLYGPMEDKRRVVPSVICSLLDNQSAKVTTGEQIRDYLHVADVATAIWAVTQSNLSGPVNIGSGRPIALRDIFTRIAAMLNRPELIALGALPQNISDPSFICANNRRLRENTNWVPQYDLEQGLHNTIEWWQQHFLDELKSKSRSQCESQ